ncbi:growth arrest specific 1 [Cricetulus griseus]
MDEDAHARSARDSDKLFERPRCRRPRLISALHRVRRPLLPAMLAALLGGGGARTGTVPGALLCLMALLQLLGSAPRGSGLAHGRRLICWQALLQCQGEPDCSYAYSQYAEACAPVLAQRGGADAPGSAGAFPASAASFSPRWRCPSHCISALIQLNHTRRGPALEDCDCAQDEHCRSTKRAIEPCLPRTSGVGPGAGAGSVMGCTEARRRCDRDSRCNLALGRYLAYCGKLFNGLRCTDECRAVIEDMLAVPKAALLNDCVCDGLERPICESVKENMARLCFGPDAGNGRCTRSGWLPSRAPVARGPGVVWNTDPHSSRVDRAQHIPQPPCAALHCGFQAAKITHLSYRLARIRRTQDTLQKKQRRLGLCSTVGVFAAPGHWGRGY